jgi:hypothetical protein
LVNVILNSETLLKIENMAPRGHNIRQNDLLAMIARITTPIKTPIRRKKPYPYPEDTPIILQGIEDSSVAAGHTLQNVKDDSWKNKGTRKTSTTNTANLRLANPGDMLIFFVGIL